MAQGRSSHQPVSLVEFTLGVALCLEVYVHNDKGAKCEDLYVCKCPDEIHYFVC